MARRVATRTEAVWIKLFALGRWRRNCSGGVLCGWSDGIAADTRILPNLNQLAC